MINDLPEYLTKKECLLNELKKNPKSNVKAILTTLQELKAACSKHILESFDESIENNFDVLEFLWKVCFYKQIEEFRSSMKKCSQSSDDGNEEWTRKRKEHALLLERSFSKNLDEAIKFYRDLLKAAELKYSSSSLLNKISLMCCKALGDLFRYKIMSTRNDDSANDFEYAKAYYLRCLKFDPESGYYYNQLGVLNQFKKNPDVAIYFYCRSSFCEVPFKNGIENLGKLYDRYVDLDVDSSPSSTYLINFIDYFLKVNGILFHSSSRYQSLSSERRKESTVVLPDVDNFDALLRKFSCYFDDAFIACCRDNDKFLFVRLIVIIISTFHFCEDKSISETNASQILTLCFLLSFLKRIINKLTLLLNEHDKRKDKSSITFLPAICVMCLWGLLHLDLLKSPIKDCENKSVKERSYCTSYRQNLQVFLKALRLLLATLDERRNLTPNLNPEISLNQLDLNSFVPIQEYLDSKQSCISIIHNFLKKIVAKEESSSTEINVEKRSENDRSRNEEEEGEKEDIRTHDDSRTVGEISLVPDSSSSITQNVDSSKLGNDINTGNDINANNSDDDYEWDDEILTYLPVKTEAVAETTTTSFNSESLHATTTTTSTTSIEERKYYFNDFQSDFPPEVSDTNANFMNELLGDIGYSNPSQLFDDSYPKDQTVFEHNNDHLSNFDHLFSGNGAVPSGPFAHFSYSTDFSDYSRASNDTLIGSTSTLHPPGLSPPPGLSAPPGLSPSQPVRDVNFNFYDF